MAIVGRDGLQIALRLSPSLKDRVHAAAKQNNRSVNAEITSTLEEKYPKPVEPESLNKALALAARDVMGAWSEALQALGQDPKGNEKLSRLSQALDRALKDY